MPNPRDRRGALGHLDRLEKRRRGRSLADELDEIARRCAAAPILDPRSPEDVIGYDEHGVPRQ